MVAKPKSPDLSGLLATKGAAKAPEAVQLRSEPEPIEAPIAAEAEPEANGAPLNFRVSASFRREFRRYAADHDMKLNEVLRAAFEALKKAESLRKV